MKYTILTILTAQLFFFAWPCNATPIESETGLTYQVVKKEISDQHHWLTRFFCLKEEFNFDELKTLQLIYQRFPKSTPIKEIENRLKNSVIKNDNIRVKFVNKADRLSVVVRFIAETPILEETRFTFTFKTNEKGRLIEVHYLTEGFSGGLSGPKDE